MNSQNLQTIIHWDRRRRFSSSSSERTEGEWERVKNKFRHCSYGIWRFHCGVFRSFFFLLCCQICVLAFFCPTQFARLLPVQETICFTFISFLFKSMWHVVFGWMVKCLTRWLYVANGVLPSEIHAIASHYFNWALCTCDRMSGVCRALIFNNCDRRKKIIVSVIRN